MINPGSVNPRVIAGAEIEEDYNRRNKIMNQDEHPLADEVSDHDNDNWQPKESAHDHDQPFAPYRINLQEMVEQQQKMIQFLFQKNTELLE